VPQEVTSLLYKACLNVLTIVLNCEYVGVQKYVKTAVHWYEYNVLETTLLSICDLHKKCMKYYIKKIL